MRARPGVAAVLGLVAGGCVGLARPNVVDVERAQARFPGTELALLARGRAAYVEKCGGCHHLYLPESRGADEWSLVLDEMAPRSFLTARERDLIERYVVTVGAR